MGDWNWEGPFEIGQGGAGGGLLSGAYEEGQAAGWSYQGCGCREGGFETFHGAQGYKVVAVIYGYGFGDGFGAGVLYIDVRQCKSAGDLFQECGLLVVGFDKGEGDLGRPELDGEAGEPGAGAEVGDFVNFQRSGRGGDRWEQMPGCEQALAEVAGYDFFGIADGSEVDAGVPAEQYIDVRRYTLQLSGGQDSRFLVASLLGMTRGGAGREEWVEQFGDAGLVHWG